MADTTSEPVFPSIWGKIDILFHPPITDESMVHEDYSEQDLGQVEEASRIRDGLAGVIDRVQGEVGLGKVHILSEEASARRPQFIQALKTNPEWIDYFSQILKVFEVDADPDEAKEHILTPWWNAMNSNIYNDRYTPGEGYHFKAITSHSFLTQLANAGRTKKGEIKFEIKEHLRPLSVGGVLYTRDNKLILGFRGGSNASDTYHLLPVGSAEPHLLRGTAFGSFDKESEEELGFQQSDYSSTQLVAKTREFLFSPTSWDYLVFRTTTDLTSAQIVSRWDNAVDKKEHRSLAAFDADPELLLRRFAADYWDVRKADPKKYGATTEANKGKILPQCIVSVMGSMVQQYGIEFAKAAEQRLSRHYDLTSCFKQ